MEVRVPPGAVGGGRRDGVIGAERRSSAHTRTSEFSSMQQGQ